MNAPPVIRLVSVATVLAATFLLSGCATKQDMRDLQTELRSELRMIQARQDSLLQEFRFQTMQTRDTLQSASRELVDIRGTLLREIRSISGKLDTVEQLVGQNQMSITQIRDQMGRVGTRPPAMATDRGSAVNRDELLVPGVEGSPDEDYDAAIRLYNRRSLFGARAAFEDFLDRYPRHELVPRVHYTLGDIAVQEDRLDDAIASFQLVGELYPEDEKVADAQYRIGVIHMDRDETRQARDVFLRIVNTYGDRDSVFLEGIVEQARDRLDEIGG